MQQLIYFFQKYRYFLFFVLLELVALFLIINNNSFHKSKFISSTNNVTGGLLEKTSKISEYFNLKTQNNELIAENVALKNKLALLNSRKDSTTNITIIDSTKYRQKYTYITAKVTRNSYHLPNNFISIDKGVSDGITKEMAVINSKGIIGITEKSSTHYSRIQSILNSNSKINARLKNSTHFGTLTWNGKEYNTVQLEDIPRQAVLSVGDTIITGGKSTIFPEGILIGTIKNTNNQNTNNVIDIQLFNDMSAIGAIYVIKNLDKQEIKNLENNSNE